MEGSAPGATLPALMMRISGQLDRLAGETFAIEEALGNELGGAAMAGAGNIMRLQRLDFLRQSLEDLALLTHFVSQRVSGPIDAEWRHRVRLDVTRALLDGSDRELPDAAPGGEVDLF